MFCCNTRTKKKIIKIILVLVLALKDVFLKLLSCTFLLVFFIYLFFYKNIFFFCLASGPNPQKSLDYIPSGINRMSFNPSVIPWVSGESRLVLQLLTYPRLSACWPQVSAVAVAFKCSSAVGVLPVWCTHRAIPGWWSVSEGVGGAGCYSARCWERC